MWDSHLKYAVDTERILTYYCIHKSMLTNIGTLQTDISGTCTVTYNKLRGMLEKTKTNCKTPEVTTKYNTVNQVNNCSGIYPLNMIY